MKVNVWVYNSNIKEFLKGNHKGYLYPLEPQYQIQLLVDIDDLIIGDEMINECRLDVE